MDDFERKVFIDGINETLPSMSLDDIKLLFQKFKVSITVETLNNVLKEGNLDVFVYLCNLIKETNPEYLKKYIDFLVKVNTENNNIKFVEFLIKQDLIINDGEKINKQFLEYCVNGNFEKLIQLWNNNPGEIDLHFNDEEPFRKSCINGHLKMKI